MKLEILCNLDSGACNPAELRKLLKRPGVTLKSHPSLHAKVWWTPKAAVLGSSNASTNGLALECESGNGWHEANVRINDAHVIDGICKWFDDLFKAGYRIESEDLDQAQALWNERKQLAPTGMRLARTLFDAYRAAPKDPVWQRVKICYWSEYLDKKDQDWLDKEIRESRLPSNTSAYGEWNDKISADDYVLDFDVKVNKPTYHGIWKALPAAAQPASLRLVTKVKWLSLHAFGRFKVSDIEQAALAGIAATVIKQHGVDDHDVLITLPQAMALIDARPSASQEKAFERAMYNIYKEAQTFGYRPTLFLKMIADHGGVETARRLMRGSATSGFEKLWENNRLDLSVEALILRPEWHSLFTEEERKLARRRLRQFNYSPPD
ncbi:phospholipase D family protein [Novacetimonas pomaceti]|uniref:phospholipase D family protein n=1 Tax=Novacetimonas pomaceti TaxID=2021998 RepID=UPI0014034DFC|nr:phospholipase D family protein [Novacetimonas pomaceti]